jgi:hypothetical protein
MNEGYFMDSFMDSAESRGTNGEQSLRICWARVEPTPGFEPGTARLQVGCAANCATPATNENVLHLAAAAIVAGYGDSSRGTNRTVAAAGRPAVARFAGCGNNLYSYRPNPEEIAMSAGAKSRTAP